MSFYVRRTNRESGRVGWTGPIRSERQVAKEAAAWEDAGWTAEVLPTSREVVGLVRAWQSANRIARGA